MGTYKQGAVGRARSLRTSQTDAERRLWSIVRNRRMHGFKFVRQLPVGPYFADFACRERDLIVEVDGGQHNGSVSDGRRAAALAEYGYEVARFWNNDVLTNLDGVYRMLEEKRLKAPSPGLRFAKPDLSPKGRGNAGAISDPNPIPRAAVATDPSPFGGEVGAKRRVRGPLGVRGGEH
ncbi:MAG: endonuclease domain-containing protein [Devosia sp.]